MAKWQSPSPGTKSSKQQQPPPSPPRPSASVVLLSPQNQILLLHRVKTSSTFPSAHVFPGGNLSSFHENGLDQSRIHEDSATYRLAAIRETFEESGILLAKGGDGDGLLEISNEVREEGRRAVHGDKVRFTEWLEQVGGRADVENLIPFTRWITPTGVSKRFTTQMYIYMLPLSASVPTTTGAEVTHTPTSDGGIEHTAATSAPTSDWLTRAQKGEIILFPPQLYLLSLLSPFLDSGNDFAAQRHKIKAFLDAVPTSTSSHPTSRIPWSDKAMCPTALFSRRTDGRLVLGLDKPGPELRDSGRGGDWERVVLVHFRKEGPRDVEVRSREEVTREEREAAREESEEPLPRERTKGKM